MKLEQLINTHLAESGETVDSFAARAGVSRATVFRVKAGEYGDFKKIKLLVNALGKPLTVDPDSPHTPPPDEARP